MRNRKKRILAVMLVLCLLVCSLSVNAFATGVEENSAGEDRSLYFIGTMGCGAGLSISNLGKASCDCYIILRAGYTADVSLELCRYDLGRWEVIKSWSSTGVSGAFTDAGIYYVLSGNIYCTRIVADVYDSDGNFVENIEAYSNNEEY